jgi:NAD(P)-dependent dehydrogenase (short-subunit alcohol dehydrogenase family)
MNLASYLGDNLVMEEFELIGKTAVVTGGGQGIGEGIAKSLARAGANIAVAARSVDRIERVAGEIVAAGGKAIAVPTDVTDRAALTKLADTAIETFGGLHVWVNNAGGSPVRSSMRELSDEDWDACVDLNLTAVWKASVVAFDRMTDGGSIIQISSPAGDRAVPGSGHYGAVKAGVNSMTKTLALEFAPHVTVNGIGPGFIPTEVMMTALDTNEEALEEMAKKQIPLKRLGKPSDIGSAAVYLASQAGSWVTGQTFNVAGGT